jgi:hypothetical protein
LNQIHFISPPAFGRRGPEYAAAAQIITSGEFRGLARYLANPYAPHAPGRAIARQHPGTGIDARGEDPREGAEALSALLGAIADEVHQHAAAARDGVLSDFAARVAHAHKHLSPHLLVAALAAFKEQRKAALAIISRNAASELAGRKKAAIMASQPKRPSSGHEQTGETPDSGPRPH